MAAPPKPTPMPAQPAAPAPPARSRLTLFLGIGAILLLGGSGALVGGLYFAGIIGGGAESAEAGGHGEEAGGHGEEAGGHGEPAAEEGSGHGEEAAAGEHGEGAKKSATGGSASDSAVVSIGQFTVNLRGTGAGRVLRIEIYCETDQGSQDAVTENNAPLRDAVVTLVSDYSYSDLEGLDGKTRLRDELLARMNALLGGNRIKRLYFTDFVIQ